MHKGAQAEAYPTNNKCKNRFCKPHTYNPGDKVMVKEDPNRKHGERHWIGPYTVVSHNDNGTVTLSRVSNRGAVQETWNIRNVDPCMA